jgi:hypothetical protein
MPIVCKQAEEANLDRTKVVVIKVRVVVDQSSSIVTGRLIEFSGKQCNSTFFFIFIECSGHHRKGVAI